MKKLYLFWLFICLLQFAFGQSLSYRMSVACSKLKQDSQLRHAIFSIVVLDAKTGKTIFSRNAAIGLAPASCQKIFTSIAALDLLGPLFRYTTSLGYDGKLVNGTLEGNLVFIGGGDPSLGSWRWAYTKEDAVIGQVINSLKKAGISKINGKLLIDDAKFSFQPIPGGWIWEDIGNYYGAGSWGLNWHENQYDLVLNAGNNKNDSVKIASWQPVIALDGFLSQIRAGEKGSGDNSYIYLSPYGKFGFADGTIPAGSRDFVISGSFPNAPKQFGRIMLEYLRQNQIECALGFETAQDKLLARETWPPVSNELLKIYSPTLDSLNFWFLKKSINLYGEIFIKTLSSEKSGKGTTGDGIEIMKDFWRKQGIDEASLHVQDGSGLSPQNRVTADALVRALQYAKSRNWYPAFYSALPEINGMRMKSGSIGGARSYAGYHQSKSKQEFIFAMMVNNYDGDASAVVKKMWQVLDLLK